MGGFTRTKAENTEEMEHVLVLFPRLRERLTQRGGSLSGGEQQMLAIARALMGRPRVLLLDEPSLGLSPILVQQIFAIIQRDQRERDHDPPRRAERTPGPQHRPPRVRPPDRPGRARGNGGGASREPYGAERLPRRVRGRSRVGAQTWRRSRIGVGGRGRSPARRPAQRTRAGGRRSAGARPGGSCLALHSPRPSWRPGALRRRPLPPKPLPPRRPRARRAPRPGRRAPPSPLPPRRRGPSAGPGSRGSRTRRASSLSTTMRSAVPRCRARRAIPRSTPS